MMDIKKAAAAALTNPPPDLHFVPPNSTTATTTSGPFGLQMLQNYAAVAAAASSATSGSNSNSTSSFTSGPHFGIWDHQAAASAMSQLFATSGATPVTSQTAGGVNSEQAALAQLNAASQIIATISAQMAQEKESKCKASTSNSNATTTSPNSNLFCSICGQVSRDQSDYEQHLMTHLTMLDPGQKAYAQYGIHLMRMQNLLNGSPKATSTSTGSTSVISTISTASTSVSSTVMSKKRKLLSAHAQSNSKVESHQQHNEALKRVKIEHEDPLEGHMSAQNLLHQLSMAAAGAKTASGLTPDGSQPAFPCTSCHKTFATEVDLKAHLIRHLTQHPYVCMSCGKGFKYEHSLNFHVKSYHSGNSNKSGSDKSPKSKDSEDGSSSPLKLKRNSKAATSSEEPLSKLSVSKKESKVVSNDDKSSAIMATTVITDENHNQTTAKSLNWATISTELSYHFGKPPTNLPPDTPIQIRSEKLLVSVLEAVNFATEQPLLFYKCCLCCVAFPSLEQMNVHISNVHLGELEPKVSVQMESKQFQCDKCSAKFSQAVEFEIHSQLHRTIEAAALASNSTEVTPASYPFILNPYITPTTVASSTTSPSVDFRQILANTSKDTDFGQKFAAQLLEGATSGHGAVPKDCTGNVFSGSGFMVDSAKTGGAADPNNNSLMYMKFAKSAPDAMNLTSGTSKASASSSASSSPKPTTKGNSAGMNQKTGSTPRHIKEPVDIFEGAGQSLPIQKFALGDIEETAPGQFKCRFCDKTFDRVFSVHRHERVHTGFKPCICKTCGRGFSEKRNLRHHIIRFHSDGSGRELLKRKRKPKTGSTPPIAPNGNGLIFDPSNSGDTAAHALMKNSLMSIGADKNLSSNLMSSLLSGSLLSAFQFNGSSGNHLPSGSEISNGSLSNLKLSLTELKRTQEEEEDDSEGLEESDEDFEDEEDEDEISGVINLSSANSEGLASGSRRRKGKPSRKIVTEDEDGDSDSDSKSQVMNKSDLSVKGSLQEHEGITTNEVADGEETEEDTEAVEVKTCKTPEGSDTEPEVEEETKLRDGELVAASKDEDDKSLEDAASSNSKNSNRTAKSFSSSRRRKRKSSR